MTRKEAMKQIESLRCEGCTWQHLDGDDYPCALCNRNPHLTDRYVPEAE